SSPRMRWTVPCVTRSRSVPRAIAKFDLASSGGTQRSSPHHSSTRLQSGSSSAASSYARPGVRPPVRTTWPPARAAATSRSAASRAGSSATTISTSATLGELLRALHRSLDRVEERRAHAGLLELADRGDRRPARRRDGLPQLDRVHSLVAELLRC